MADLESKDDQLPPLPVPMHTFRVGGGRFDTFSAKQMRAYRAEGVAAERERCAKICDGMRSEPTPYQGELEYRVSEKAYEVAQECAAAIRSTP